MAKNLDHLLYLWLENGLAITDTAFNALLQANRRLSILIVENFPLLSQIDLSGKNWLSEVKFSDCPNLSDKTLLTLEGIRALTLVSCPNITAEGLKKIPPSCKINIANCERLSGFTAFHS
jgi:hypothetical protein